MKRTAAVMERKSHSRVAVKSLVTVLALSLINWKRCEADLIITAVVKS